MQASSGVDTVAAAELADTEFGAAWERLRCAVDGSTPFARIDFAQELSHAFGYVPSAHVVRDAGGKLIGGVLCYVRKLGPYARAVVPPFVQYTPVLLASPAPEHAVHGGASTLQTLLIALNGHYGGVALNLPPEVQDVRPAVWSGYRVRPLYTYRIALAPGHPVLSAWSENAIRLFRRFTGDFTFSEDPEYADAAVQLCAEGYARHDRPLPIREDRLLALVRNLSERGLVDVFTLHSQRDGTCEAGMVVLRDEMIAHYWIAGSRPGPAMTVLLGRVLERLTEAGIGTFDMVGANTPSIAEFKRKFGPRLDPYFRLESTRALGLRMLDFARGHRV